MVSKFQYPITFLPCRDLDENRQFYEQILGLPVALEQEQCILYKIGTEKHFSYWGFCSHYEEYLQNEKKVCLSLIVDTNEEVDEWHAELTKKGVKCIKEPGHTPRFKIYNGFYEDPMGYTVEIQAFYQDGKPEGV
jgi:catechol 2,3-dioxygenase-like lactoylglutathione lyase family enzyme